MTGSLQIKNNKYYAVLNVIGDDGKRKQKWIATNLEVKGNKKKAAKILERLLEEHDERNHHYEDVLLADYLTDWLERVRHTIEPSTYRGYSGNLRNHIHPYFMRRRIKLNELCPYHLEDFYAHLMSEKNLSSQSVRHNHRLLSKALNDALRHDIISSNPTQRVVLPKVKKFVGSFLNPEQLQHLLTLFEDTEVKEAVAFIATYGMRRSEALGLCWDKVDFNNNQFVIARAMIQNGEHGYYLKDCTKNESSYRTLPMTKDIRTMLLALKDRQEQNKLFFGNTYVHTDFVFTWPDGNPITPNYITRVFHNVVVESDLPPVRLHDLRHSTASNLLAHGFSVVEVQHWLGHSQASTTLNFYSHIDATSKTNIRDALEDLLPLEKC